jgi:CRISPR system Cascade subunit CasD
MSTLLLKLSAPLQSWGADSKFDRRNTEREPTKSGVIGLIACALGYGRDADAKISELSALRFGVRVDEPGVLLRDFHIAKVKGEDNPRVTNRYYLADAKFTAGLEGDVHLLQQIAVALQNPVWPLYLGRRSCPPAEKVFVEITDKPLREALSGGIWVLFDAKTGVRYKRDVPESFSKSHRKFGFRRIEEERRPREAATNIEHDAFKEV